MRKIFWIAMVAISLGVSVVSGTSGLTGDWNISIFGVAHGAVWDPGGSYLGSSLLLFEQRFSPFIGHPGLPLMLICQAIARGMYWLSGTHATFQHFAGRNIYQITLVSSVVMTALFLATFAVLEQIAMKILGNERLALLAVLGYATTYPALYYINRISPESLLVLFSLLAFLWLWRYYELGDSPRALAFLALSAQAAVAALYTKAMIVGPIVAFIPFQILVVGTARRARKIRDAALYVVFATPAMLAGAWKVDWTYFFKFWFGYAPGSPQYVSSQNWATNVLENAGGTGTAMLASAFRNLAGIPALTLTTRAGLFFCAEAVFFAISLSGVVMYWRGSRVRPALLGWFLGFVAITAVPYLQRGPVGWHYLHLQLAVAAIFFSYGIARCVRRVTGLTQEARAGWLACCGATLVVHALAIVLFIDMQRHNAQQNRLWEAYYRAPSMVEEGSFVGLSHTLAMPEILQPIDAYLPTEGFVDEYRRYFVPVVENATDDELRRKGVTLVVSLGPTDLTFRRVPK